MPMTPNDGTDMQPHDAPRPRDEADVAPCPTDASTLHCPDSSPTKASPSTASQPAYNEEVHVKNPAPSEHVNVRHTGLEEFSPTDGSTLYDFLSSPTTTDSLQKPEPNTAIDEVDRNATPATQLSKPFRLAETGLRKIGALRVPAIRRIWSHVSERPVEAIDDDYNTLSDPTWRTTVLRLGPLSGIFCMLLAVSTMVASLGVLVGSNGHAVDSWSAPPSTYLAVSTAVANLGVRYACSSAPLWRTRTVWSKLTIIQVCRAWSLPGGCEQAEDRR